MTTSGSGKATAGYNVQTAVDAKHHLIVANEVINVRDDRTQLAKMVKPAKQAMGSDTLDVVAERGYFRGEELRACDDVQITT